MKAIVYIYASSKGMIQLYMKLFEAIKNVLDV